MYHPISICYIYTKVNYNLLIERGSSLFLHAFSVACITCSTDWKGELFIMIKTFEAFAGVGAQRMALELAGIKHEVVGISEIDKFAIKSYEAIHGETKNFGDISKVEVEDLPDFDLFTYSFPCTQISIAGTMDGFERGSGTESSLLWECQRIIEAKRPQFLLMENVKNLVGKKFMPGFQEWIDYLDSIGYTSHWQVLNAKDYGVPQNRERVFMVSALQEDFEYSFPEKQPLQIQLKDVLEEEVDPKYYLKKELQEKFVPLNTVKILDDTYGFDSKTRVYEDTAPTLRAGRQGLKVQMPKAPAKGAAMRGRYVEDGKTEQQLEVRKDNLSNALTTVQKDTLVIQGRLEQKGWQDEMKRIYNPEGISPTLTTMQGGYRQPKIIQRPRGFNKGGMHDISPTITTSSWEQNNILLDSDAVIRKLTPRECWRLMAFSDEAFDKAREAGISDTQLYKQAGNSIVVNVLAEIFHLWFNK